MAPSSKPIQKPGYRLEMIEDELLLYHPHKTRMIYCNQSASLVWRLCDGCNTVAEMTAALSEAFPEAEATIADDVAGILKQFLESGCIVFE